MAQPTFETLIHKGRQVARYGFMRDVDYLEKFRFWSANVFPSKLWRPRYYGHVILESTAAVVAIYTPRLMTEDRIKSAIVGIDPALRDHANSNEAAKRTQVGAIIAEQAIRSFLFDELKTSDEARSEYVAITRDREQQEQLRQQGVAAI